MISHISIIGAAVLAGATTVGLYIPVCKIREIRLDFIKEISELEDEALDKIENSLIYVVEVTSPDRIIGMPIGKRILISKKALELKNAMEEFDKIRNRKPSIFKLMKPNSLSRIAKYRKDALFKCIDITSELNQLIKESLKTITN